jgi:hypothetical protein
MPYNSMLHCCEFEYKIFSHESRINKITTYSIKKIPYSQYDL